MNENRNIYDFDGTIYNGNSSIDFFIFCLIQNPKILKYVNKNLQDLIKHKLGLIDLETTKEEYCKFLTDLDNLDILVLKFWKLNLKKIKKWYLDQKQNTDIIITSSPDFLIEPIGKYLNVQVITSIIDKTNGEIKEFCFRSNKLNMLNNLYPSETFNEFYTDNPKDDECLLTLAKNSYIVKGNKRSLIKSPKRN